MSTEGPSTPEVPGQNPSGYSKDERMWGMLCHLSALSGLLTAGAGNIVGPIVVWMLKKNDFPFVDDQGKESVNFQISMLIYGAVAAILSLVGIGILIGIAIAIFDLVQVVMASMKANDGVAYRYPLNLRLIK